MTSSQSKPLSRWLGHHPGRTLLRISSTVFGVAATAWLLGQLWPKPDQIAGGASPSLDNPATLSPYPDQPVTVLLIGVDADQVIDVSNGAAPNGLANADALMLVRIDPSEALQVLQVPIELAVRSPGEEDPVTLASLWRAGGVSLLRDAIREIVGLTDDQPHRYVVMPRAALRSVVDGLGSVELILSQAYTHEDQAQGYRVNIQAGRQSISGVQAEQLVRLRRDPKADSDRRIRQQLLIRAVVDQIQAPGGIRLLPAVVRGLSPLLETNLTSGEMLSLAAAVVASPPPVQIQQLPLAKRAGHQTLRQLKPGESLPLWPPL